MLGNGISDGVGIGYAKTIENVQTTYTVVDIGTPDEEKSRLSGGIEKLLLKIKSGNNLSLNKGHFTWSYVLFKRPRCNSKVK